MDVRNSVCSGFDPEPSVSYTNCTGSGFISNWTVFCCQPLVAKDWRYPMLSLIGIVGIVGVVCNIITIITFMYLCCFKERIKSKFGHDFSMVEDPVFYLILHLSLCDLFFCTFGLPSYWIIYYHGYFPFSEDICKFSAFFRNIIGRMFKSIHFNSS